MLSVCCMELARGSWWVVGYCCFVVIKLCPTLWDRLLCPSPSPGACSNSSPLSQWCHPTILSSVIPFSSHLQSFPASGSFLMSRLYASGGQRIGASISASVLPMNIEDRFPLGLTGLISLQSKWLSRVFSSTTIQKHQSFSAQPSLWIDSHWSNLWIYVFTNIGHFYPFVADVSLLQCLC